MDSAVRGVHTQSHTIYRIRWSRYGRHLIDHHLFGYELTNIGCVISTKSVQNGGPSDYSQAAEIRAMAVN